VSRFAVSKETARQDTNRSIQILESHGADIQNKNQELNEEFNTMNVVLIDSNNEVIPEILNEAESHMEGTIEESVTCVPVPRRSARIAMNVSNAPPAELGHVYSFQLMKPKKYSAFEATETDPAMKLHDCGPLQHKCNYCGALHFEKERPRDDAFTKCCHKGSVKLGPVDVPSYMKDLYQGQQPESLNFRNNIRQYNNSFAFTSMGAKVCSLGAGPYCFKIHGQIYHRMSDAMPEEGARPHFSQLYFMDPTEALEQRISEKPNENCLPEVLPKIDQLLRNVNPFACSYQFMREKIEEQSTTKTVIMDIITNKSQDHRRYNAPTATEVAIIFEADADGSPPLNRDIRIYPRGGHYQQISILNPNLDPMVYPLFFVHGEKGWSEGLTKNNSTGNVTHLQFYAYRIAIRNEFNPILHGGKLFQQFVVDVYVRIEANRLNWIKFNQKKLRAESYSGLVDYVAGICDQNQCKLGKLVILPSSFQGSPRAMHQNYQDAMSIVSCHSSPDLFITMTCNPNWIEIVSNSYSNQTASDRPDLVARVFNIKLNELIDDITKRHIFGEVEAYFYTIEFQKRGLPHAHILAILKDKDKIRDPETIDKIISAELLHPNFSKLL